MAARRKLTKKPATGSVAKAASKHAEDIRARNQKLDAVTVSVIKDSASGVHQTILKKGKYAFLCTVPGHAAGGMKGTLTVK